MKLFDIIKKVGGSVLANAVPGGSLLLGAVNALLPSDKQLPLDATGHQMDAVIETLSGTERASIMEKEFDVQITEIKEGNETLRIMLESDASNPHSTRPYIAMHSFHVLAIVTILTAGIWAYGVFTENVAVINAVSEGWPFIIAITGTFTSILLSYFGNLVKEHKNKMDAANGSTKPSGLAGIASAIFKK